MAKLTKKRCEKCKCDVTANQWSRHLKTKKHKGGKAEGKQKREKGGQTFFITISKPAKYNIQKKWMSWKFGAQLVAGNEWGLSVTLKMAFYGKRRVFNRRRFYAKKRFFNRRRRNFYRRRRAPVRRRTYRRRGNFMKRIYKGIVHSEHKASHEFNLGAKGVYTSNLCWNWHTFLTGSIKSQTSSYLNLFDEVKIRHVTLVYWLRNNGSNSLTYEQPTMTTTYDPDAQGRTMSIDNQNCCPNTRERLIRYGKKYKLRMYPKFQPKLSAAKSVAIGGKSLSPWIDAAYFTYEWNYLYFERFS
ncbi:hypothetical protein LOTGIDRAFT_155098 [Lottia gigantea]|uniref:Capsid protein n=1 Tax=Lottia gigantea TaxID=225164 RepID=V3ZSQ6_LOTGI|nr:hypothetical protein LOTGIDRAFT_155098 [Lottia gigantea]ESO85610.1 hypothetical protein LOTGIDRAFT_155098 [Lottia gigantea]